MVLALIGVSTNNGLLDGETPSGVHLQGLSYPDLCEQLARLREQPGLEFRGFSELSEKFLN